MSSVKQEVINFSQVHKYRIMMNIKVQRVHKY